MNVFALIAASRPRLVFALSRCLVFALALGAAHAGRSQEAPEARVDLAGARLVLAPDMTGPERKAAQMLLEETQKRSQLAWPVSKTAEGGGGIIYLGQRDALARAFPDLAGVVTGPGARQAEGYRLVTSAGRIVIAGNDARGVLYGAGDFIAQTAVALRTEAVASRPFEGNRCLRAIVFASVFLAPLTHAHDHLLEVLVVVRWRLRRAHAAWAKLVLAQFVLWSYFSAAYYHVVLGALQGLPPLECMHALASSFWPTVWAQASAADCN